MIEAYPPLIKPQELATLLNGEGDVVAVDCRHQLMDHSYGPKVYQEGHIPGARYADMEEVLSGPKTGSNGRHPMPDWSGFTSWLGAQGISNETYVVVYDDDTGVYASRLWYMLLMLGHKAVSVLDGGLTAWEVEDLPIDKAIPEVTPTTFNGEPGLSMLAPLPEVQALSEGRGEYLLVDARGNNRYRGEDEIIDPRAGHIPGAVNLYFGENNQPNRDFKSPDELRARLLATYGDTPPERTVHYCGSGVSACHNLLAHAVAGLPLGRLYTGSWSEWCADPKRPAATGDKP